MSHDECPVHHVLCQVRELLQRMPAEQINTVPMTRDFMKCECMQPPRRGNCALLVAAISRNSDMVQLLLEFKAHPDTVNEEGLSALVVACENMDEGIVAALLQHRANPDIPSPDGSFPLHIAGQWAAGQRMVCMQQAWLGRGVLSKGQLA